MDTAAGDRPAPPADFVAFCHEQHRRLVASLVLFCGDPGLAEEIAQEALAKACQHWERVRSMDAPGAWLHRVALNVARSRFRRAALERRVTARAGTPTVHHDIDVAEMLDLRQALATLPERRRTAVVLRHVAGLSVTETASAMAVSETAVRSLTSRALSELRARLRTGEVQHAR
jgi:RNA polymerase sigma-70 factor (sigma-E family)